MKKGFGPPQVLYVRYTYIYRFNPTTNYTDEPLIQYVFVWAALNQALIVFCSSFSVLLFNAVNSKQEGITL